METARSEEVNRGAVLKSDRLGAPYDAVGSHPAISLVFFRFNPLDDLRTRLKRAARDDRARAAVKSLAAPSDRLERTHKAEQWRQHEQQYAP